MSATLSVYLNADPRGVERRLVSADLVRRNAKSVIVALPDGNRVKRKIARDVPALQFEASA